MSGSSTPVLDEIPPVSVSVQDIFDGIVLEASQLNQLLSVGEEINMEDVESESEESPDVSENEREFSEPKGERKDGGVSEPSKVESVTPVGQDAKPEIMRVTPVVVGHIEKKGSEKK